MPRTLHGAGAITYGIEHLKQLDKSQTQFMRTQTHMPKYTPSEYLQAEIGYSSSKCRDMRSKISLLQHILKNLNTLKEVILEEWNKNNHQTKWISTCKNYLSELQINFEDLPYIPTKEIIKKINSYGQQQWSTKSSEKNSLTWYSTTRNNFKNGIHWHNTKEENIGHRFDSDALLYNSKLGKEREDKICPFCPNLEDQIHIIEKCNRYADIRKKHNMEMINTKELFTRRYTDQQYRCETNKMLVEIYNTRFNNQN